MRIGDRHRGFFGYRTTFHGRAAHSSDPSAGASAIYSAAEFVRFLRTAGDDGGDGIERTTFNVGRIDGGTAINIVPHRCEVVWEFRPSAGSDVGAIRTTIDDFIARSVVHGVKFDHAALTSVPPLASRNDNAALKLAHDLGAELPTLAMPFGTEAGFFQAAESRPLYAGPGSIDQAHQPDEWITVAQLEAGSRFLDRLGAWASTEAPPEAGWVTGRALGSGRCRRRAEWQEHAYLAIKHEPVLKSLDRFGQRIDAVEFIRAHRTSNAKSFRSPASVSSRPASSPACNQLELHSAATSAASLSAITRSIIKFTAA